MVDTTCVQYVTKVALSHIPTDQSTQLTVLSIGFNLEHVSAELIKRFLDQDAHRIFCVVLPDGLRNGTVTRVANALRPHLKTHTKRSEATSLQKEQRRRSVNSLFYYKNVSLHVIDEGTSTKDRCSAFQRGGIVVCSSRTLCADMLHRRLSTECIGLVIILFPFGSVVNAMHETITPSLAFCVEMLLRGVNCHGEHSMQTQINNKIINSSRYSKDELKDVEQDVNDLPMTCVTMQSKRPCVVLLSNHPVFMQYLVQRHHIGLERFTHQMHIGDIELFPRFRLEFIKHFEELAKTKPLHIDRMNVDVNTSTQVLDRLLEEIILEVLNELHVMEARLERALNDNNNSTSLNDKLMASSQEEETKTKTRTEILRERRRSEAEQMDEDSYHLMPRARARYESLPSSSSSNTQKTHTRDHNKPSRKEEQPRKSLQYIYKPWRDKTNPRKVHFALIESEMCTEVQVNALDTDLALLLRANEPNWPYRALVESLLDVRHLRRSLRGSSAFDFLFALEHALEKRIPQRSVFMGHVAPPAALWTLSSHFADVVTVATERIGRVIRVPLFTHTNKKTPSTKMHLPEREHQLLETHENEVEIINIDDSDDSEKLEEEKKESSNCNNNNEISVRMMLVPNSSEPDQEMDLMYRLVTSWARDVCRKVHKGQKNNSNSNNEKTNTLASTLPKLLSKQQMSTTPPAFLILASNQREMVRCVERLIHTKRVFDRLQLNHFLIRYQMRCGISVEAHQSSSDEDSQEDEEHYVKSGSDITVKNEKEEQEEESLESSPSLEENNTNDNDKATRSENKKTNKRQIFEIDDDGVVRKISLSEWLASCDGVINVEEEEEEEEEEENEDEIEDNKANNNNKNDDDDDSNKKKTNGKKCKKEKINVRDGNNTNSSHRSALVKTENAQPSSMLLSQYSPPVVSSETTVNQNTQSSRGITTTCTSSPYSLHHILLTQPTLALDDIHEQEEEELEEQQAEKDNSANQIEDPLLETKLSTSITNVKKSTNASTVNDMIAFEVESLGRGFALLTTSEEFVQRSIHTNISETTWPRLMVVDTNTIHDVDIVEMIYGTHVSLQRWSSYSSEEEQQEEQELEEENEVVEECTKTSIATEKGNTERDKHENNKKICEMRPCAAVRRILLMHQSVQLLRMMEMVQDAVEPHTLSLVKVQLISSPIMETDFTHVTQQEREAFQSLAHAKATLTGTLLADRAAQRRTLEELQSIVINPRGRQALRQQNHLQLQRSKFMETATQLHSSSTDMPINANQQQKREKELQEKSSLSLLEQEMQNNERERQSIAEGEVCTYNSTEPMIVFDEREFRSTLPYSLYSKGMDLVPLTLITADYVLSPEYAIERKSVKDYNQSLQSGRIFHQLAALSRRYAHPMCLIEFNRSEPFRLTYSTVWRSSLETSSMSILYGRTARLMGNYPQVRFLWARSPAHSASMMLALKQGPASDNVDVTDPLLTGRGVDAEDGQLGAGKEAAHYAARVLARFPGVTQTNIQAIMELSGSLAGLATISQQSFEKVMGCKAAEELFQFLHNPLAETVE